MKGAFPAFVFETAGKAPSSLVLPSGTAWSDSTQAQGGPSLMQRHGTKPCPQQTETVMGGLLQKQLKHNSRAHAAHIRDTPEVSSSGE